MTANATHDDLCWSRLPVFRPGGRLTAEQLNTALDDAIKRERLLNLALHGVGIVHGFDLRMRDDGDGPYIEGCRLWLGCGLALDRWGRVLYWPGGWIAVDDTIGQAPDRAGSYTLLVHYAERAEAPGWDPCQDDPGWLDRCVVFTLRRDCAPYDACPQDLPSDACASRRDFSCARTGQQSEKANQSPDLNAACQDPPELRSSDCGRVRYDPSAGLPLACVEICDVNRDRDGCAVEFQFCDCASSTDVAQTTPANCGCDGPDPCAMRPIAYRAPLLHELINDADVHLARVRSFSWSETALGPWDTRMPYSEFKQRVLAYRAIRDDPPDYKGDPGPEDGFAITFTRPVDPATLHPLSVLMEVHARHNEFDENYGCYRVATWQPHRVPILIKPILHSTGGAIGLRICPVDSWFHHAAGLLLQCSNQNQLARVEITLRGAVIRDMCGCMLDARPPDLTCRDHCATKTGQAMPGGDWRSLFRIGPDARSPAQDQTASTDTSAQPQQSAAPSDELRPQASASAAPETTGDET